MVTPYDELPRLLREADRIANPLREYCKHMSVIEDVVRQMREHEELTRLMHEADKTVNLLPDYNAYFSSVADELRAVQQQGDSARLLQAAQSAIQGDIRALQKQQASARFLESEFVDAVAAFQSTADMLSSVATCSPALEAISRANASISRLAEQYLHTDWTLEQGQFLNESWRLPVIPVESHVIQETARMALESHYSQMMDSSLRAQRLLAGLSWEGFGAAVSKDPVIIEQARAHFIGLTDQYARLLESFTDRKCSIANYGPVISGFPPAEMIIGSHLVISVSRDQPVGEDDREYVNSLRSKIQESLESGLSALDPKLVQLWQGAKKASRDPADPDRKRHVSVSLRELLTHVLHMLAPDDKVCQWTSRKEHFHNGRPTRQARLLFICRSVSSAPFTEFVDRDVASTLSFIDLFQTGTHQLEVPFSDSQIDALILQAESRLRFLLSVASTAK